MDNIIDIFQKYKDENTELFPEISIHNHKLDFNQWIIPQDQEDFAKKILLESLKLEKATLFDQLKQSKYYEALRWSVLSICRALLTKKDFNSYFELVRSVFAIKNTNMTFLVKLMVKLISKIEYIRELFPNILKLIKDIILLCDKNNNISMRNKMNIKLSEIYLINEEYKTGLEIISKTLVDLKRYEDNLGLIEIQLIESKIHFKSKGIVKAKAALTTVKTLCTKVYIEPQLQAKIDMHAGMLTAHEKDYNLAYSYFYESFDVYNLPQVRKPDIALKALQYMILCKILNGKLDDLNSIIYGKNQYKYYGREVEALKLLEKAVKDKNTKLLGEIVAQNKDIFLTDYFINYHLTNLHDDLLEKNIKKIIEPYSVVEINYVTKIIGIDNNEILNKLSQMILDKKINGILDQGKGSLIIYEDSLTNEYLEKSLNVYKNLDKVVDSLFYKTKSSTFSNL